MTEAARRGAWIAIASATVLGAAYSYVVPLGEAPDEAAHVFYLHELVERGTLPSYRPAEEPLSYEAHQPPLDYLLLSALAPRVGVAEVPVPFVADPRLDFRTAGSRAFLPVSDSGPAGRALHRLRLLRLAWLPLTLWLIAAALPVSDGSDVPFRLFALFSIGLAPQLLFTSATVNDDGAVAFFSALAFLLARRLAERGPGAVLLAAGTGGACALAFWSKGTGLATLALPALVIAWWIRRRGAARAIAALAVPVVLGGLALLLLNEHRFGTPGFRFPVGGVQVGRGSLLRLVAEPQWLGTLWSSFFARFGWFNLKLPAWEYALFLPATFAGFLGAPAGAAGHGGRGGEAQGPSARALALAVIAANLAVVVGFMVLVNWQPQGRLLFASLSPIAFLVFEGARRWGSSRVGERRRRLLLAAAVLWPLVMFAVNVHALLVIRAAYGGGRQAATAAATNGGVR